MAITIQNPTFLGQQAQQNYFQALMQKARLESAQDRQNQAQRSRANLQSVSTLQSAIQNRYSQDRQDQRFDQRAKLVREGRDQSSADRLGVTVDDYQSLQEGDGLSKFLANRQQQQNQQQVQLAYQKQQARNDADLQQEQQSKMDQGVEEWVQNGAPADVVAEYNQLKGELTAWRGTERSGAGDPPQIQNGVRKYNEGMSRLFKRIPKQKTNAQKFKDMVFVAGEDEETKPWVDANIMKAGKTYYFEMRNGAPVPKLVDGQMTDKEEVSLLNDKEDLRIKRMKVESKASESGDGTKDTIALRAAANKSLKGRSEVLGYAPTKIEEDEEMVRLSMSPDAHALRVENEKKVRAGGKDATIARYYFKRAEKQQRQNPRVTGEQLMKDHMRMLLGAMKQERASGQPVDEEKYATYQRIEKALRAISLAEDVSP